MITGVLQSWGDQIPLKTLEKPENSEKKLTLQKLKIYRWRKIECRIYAAYQIFSPINSFNPSNFTWIFYALEIFLKNSVFVEWIFLNFLVILPEKNSCFLHYARLLFSIGTLGYKEGGKEGSSGLKKEDLQGAVNTTKGVYNQKNNLQLREWSSKLMGHKVVTHFAKRVYVCLYGSAVCNSNILVSESLNNLTTAES